MVDRSPGREVVRPTHGLDRFFRACAHAERWVSDHAVATLAVGLGASLLVEQAVREDLGSWDWVWVSGMLAVALGLPPAFRLLDAADHSVDRLADRGVLTGSSRALAQRTRERAELLGRIGGPVLGVAVLVAFLTRVATPSTSTGTATGFADIGNQLPEVLLGCVAAFFVGRAAGGALAIATLGRRIAAGPWRLQAQPGNVDGAAGLRPVGDLFFRQAMVIAIPAVWLICVLGLKTLAVVGADGWIAVRQVVGAGRGWGAWYFALLVAAVGSEIAAFIVPMLFFHRVMLGQKHELERAVDQRSQLLHSLEEQLPTIADDEKRHSMEEQISRIREHSLRIEQMPTWPVDASLRRRFTLRNAVLLVPVVANAIGLTVQSESWSTLSGILGG